MKEIILPNGLHFVILDKPVPADFVKFTQRSVMKDEWKLRARYNYKKR